MTMGMTLPPLPTRRLLTIPIDGRSVTVTYRPNDITISNFDGVEDAPYETALTLICSCVATWSVDRGGFIPAGVGNVYPITPRYVARLPEQFVYDLAAAISADVRLALGGMIRTTGQSLEPEGLT